jgi:hypothetical protein
MGLFAKTFSIILEQTWNHGYVNMFLPQKESVKKGPRHRRALVLDPFKRKHAQTVPDMHKPDMTIIQQVERVKNNPSVNIPLNSVQLKKICKKYGIYSVSKIEPKKLGNTGIQIIWDEGKKSFILKK